ncbi:hypothetical protein VR611_06220 [Aquirufa nivalisilvae]
MRKNQQVEFLHPNILLLITPKGALIELFTPIRALVKEEVGSLKVGTTVYIDAILQSQEHRILYCIIGKWYPYHHFKVGK